MYRKLDDPIVSTGAGGGLQGQIERGGIPCGDSWDHFATGQSLDEQDKRHYG